MKGTGIFLQWIGNFMVEYALDNADGFELEGG